MDSRPPIDADSPLDELIRFVHREAGEGKGLETLRTVLGFAPRPPALALAAVAAWSFLENFLAAAQAIDAIDPATLDATGERTYRSLFASIERGRRNQEEEFEVHVERNARCLEVLQPELARAMRAASLGSEHTWIVEGGRIRFVATGGPDLRTVDESVPDDVVDTLHRYLYGTPHALLFRGIHCAHTLSRAVELHPAPGETIEDFTVPFYVIENSQDLFLLHLMFTDFEELLRLGNIFFFVGPTAVEDLAEFVRASPYKPLPIVVLSQQASGGHDVDEILTTARHEATRQLAARIVETYEPVTVGVLRERFAPGSRRKLRVLCISDRFTSFLKYCTRDIEKAFSEIGCETLYVEQPSGIDRLTIAALGDEVLRFLPDLVFMVCAIRPAFPGAFPPNIPFVAWIQDELPRLFLGGEAARLIARLGDLDFIYAVVDHTRDRCHEVGYRDVGILPVSADTSVYAPPDAPEPRFDFDVVHASHFTVFQIPGNWPKGLTEAVWEVFRAEGIEEVEFSYFPRLLRRVEDESGIEIPEEQREDIAYRLQFLARYFVKGQVVTWVAEGGYRLAVFGKGWETIPEFAAYARGPVKPGPDLRNMYHTARINLQIGLSFNYGQRVFECIASGGFIMCRALASDRRPGGLCDFFEIGEEIVTFDGRDDLCRKIDSYLGNEDARRRVIEAGRARLLSQHTYPHHTRRILDDVRARLDRLAAAPPAADR